MARKYVKQGGNGGVRKGAGRTPGTKDVLPRGAVAALKGLRHRVPAGTPEVIADVADEAFASLVDVMRGRHRYGGSQDVLRAATAIRAEVCGPIVQKLEHTGADGQALIVEVRSYAEDEAGPATRGEPDGGPTGVVSGGGRNQASGGSDPDAGVDGGADAL